jgi:hypothetical protein
LGVLPKKRKRKGDLIRILYTTALDSRLALIHTERKFYTNTCTEYVCAAGVGRDNRARESYASSATLPLSSPLAGALIAEGLFWRQVVKIDCRTCDVCFDFLRTADCGHIRVAVPIGNPSFFRNPNPNLLVVEEFVASGSSDTIPAGKSRERKHGQLRASGV